ncbi:hypothetical protein [Desulfosarcina cetonica]|uniref:hypothetical protein n=1 Tax=Desulfosarcina cetonica TaxID=90730 RepID=UPI001C4796F9|nr:hypothetical protein [Desulfosarcina cetonica]
MQAIADAVQAQRAFFRTGSTLDIDFRITQLKTLRDALLRYENRFYEAFRADLKNRPWRSSARKSDWY